MTLLTPTVELQCADIGNAYLEAYTAEKVCFFAGKEFAPFCLEGHTMVVVKALYGLKTSGKRWNERFSDVLREEGFTQSKADGCIWMRPCKDGSCYEYIATYVDDLAAAMKDPTSLMNKLQEHYKFKLKGVGPISFHLGCDFDRDPDGTLKYTPKKYIAKMMETYQRHFGELPKEVTSLLPKGDHPELDDSPLGHSCP